MPDGSISEVNSWVIRRAKRFGAQGRRGWAVLLCFLEGVRRPDLPAAFVLGMRNARPGSWFEKVFAREVWKSNNLVNALEAHDVLALRHDERPSIHPVPEVNLALLASLREPPPEPQLVPVPPSAPRPSLKRNHRIRLFAGAETRREDES